LAKIRPFKAIRPSRDKAYLVATRPYYAYKKHVLAAKLETNPYTFLHVINPEFHEDDKTEPNSVERYQKSRERLDEFIDDGVFIQDEIESLYLYRQSSEKGEFVGLIGGASVEDYKADKIKKHEATITSREKHFSDYLRIVECNAEPVLLFHREHETLNTLFDKIMKERPEYEFSTTQRIKHEIWLIQETPYLELIHAAYDEIDDIYIADGHHRSASSVRYSEEVNAAKDGLRNFFLAYFISEKNMQIMDYNRLVHDLSGLTREEFLEKLEEKFEVNLIKDVEHYERKMRSILLYIGLSWYEIKIPKEMINPNDVVDSLDTAILTREILDPILGIKDLKIDSRISFINGVKGLEGIEETVNEEKAICGFALFPVTVQQLKAAADNNKIMPPKSTWIEPKLRSGLTMYPLNHD